MKKLLAVLLVLVMALGLVACGGSGEGEEAGDAAMKVGFIYIGSVNDGGYTQAQHQGTVAMEEYFEGKVETVWIESGLMLFLVCEE